MGRLGQFEVDISLNPERVGQMMADLNSLRDLAISTQKELKAVLALRAEIAAPGTSDNMSAEWWHREADRYCGLHIAAHRRILELEAKIAEITESGGAQGS